MGKAPPKQTETAFHMCPRSEEHKRKPQEKSTDATYLLWLAPLSLCRGGLNPLTRPESTLTGLIRGLSWGLAGTD